MLFNDSFLTNAGANLFAIAASYYDSSDPTSGIIWGTVRTSNYDTNSFSDEDMKALTDIKTNSTSYNTSGVVTSTIRNNDAGSLSIFSEINNDNTTTGSNAYTLGIWAKLANDSNETLVVVARTGNNVTPSYINPASAGQVISFVNLEIEISGHPVQSTTSAANWYASADALQELANSLSNEIAARETDFSRAVTTHSAESTETGDDQIIHGDKTFLDNIIIGKTALNSDTQLQNNLYRHEFTVAYKDLDSSPYIRTQYFTDSDSFNSSSIRLSTPLYRNHDYWSSIELVQFSDTSYVNNNRIVLTSAGMRNIYAMESKVTINPTSIVGNLGLGSGSSKIEYKCKEDYSGYVLNIVNADTNLTSLNAVSVYTDSISTNSVVLGTTHTIDLDSNNNLQIDATVIPNTSNTYDIGSSVKRFKNAYFNNISCNNVYSYLDSLYDIGTQYNRFKDLYLSGTVYALAGLSSSNRIEISSDVTVSIIGKNTSATITGGDESQHKYAYLRADYHAVPTIKLGYSDGSSDSGVIRVEKLKIYPETSTNSSVGTATRPFEHVYANNIYGSNASLYDIEVDESNRDNNTCSPGSLFIANSSEFSGASAELVANYVPYNGSYDLQRYSWWITINGNGNGSVFNYLFIRIRRGQFDLNHIDVVGKYADSFIANHLYLPHGVTKIDSDYMWLEKNTEDPNNNYCYTLKYSNSYTGIAESFDVCTLSLGVIRSLPLLYNSSSYSYSVTEDSNDNTCFSDSINIVNRELYFLNEVIFRLPFLWGDITDSPVAKLQSATSTAAVVIGKTL